MKFTTVKAKDIVVGDYMMASGIYSLMPYWFPVKEVQHSYTTATLLFDHDKVFGCVKHFPLDEDVCRVDDVDTTYMECQCKDLQVGQVFYIEIELATFVKSTLLHSGKMGFNRLAIWYKKADGTQDSIFNTNRGRIRFPQAFAEQTPE